MELDLKLATGPVTWGVDFADAPGNPPWQVVLDEIERSGVGALELGPVGYLPEDPAALGDALRSRGLTAVGSFVFEDLHDHTQSRRVAAVAIRASRAIAAAGGSVLVIIDRPSAARGATAGRSADAARLRGPAWRSMLDRLEATASVARDHGLTPVIHPHAGSFIEFDDEIERLLDATSLDLCLDTGHTAFAGMNPGASIAAYAPRIAHVHLKDVRADVLRRVRDERLGFWPALEQGVFCPLGEGTVGLAEVLAALADADYTGYATIEQDRVAGSGSPLEDLLRSVAAIRAARAASAVGTGRAT
jgi:inosose dehydratase